MNRLQRYWLHLQGQTCHTCHFFDSFRSNGDGQVSRMHTFCRNPDAPYHNRPIPSDPWCDAWMQLELDPQDSQ